MFYLLPCNEIAILLLFSNRILQREHSHYPWSGMPMLVSGGGGTFLSMEDLS